MTRIEWGDTDRNVSRRIATYGERVKAGMLVLGQQWGARLEAAAKANAPWTDRTANARQGLWGKAFVIRNGATVVIVLAHSMDYGIYLERRNQARYAIIMPTLESNYAAVWNSYKQLVGAR